MKNILTYNKFINESLKDLMKPKSEEEINNIISNWNPNKRLVWASSNGYLDIVKKSLKDGADINWVNEYPSKYNWTPLFYASLNGYYEIVEYLLKHGAIVNNEIMRYTYERGHYKIIGLLKKYYTQNLNESLTDKMKPRSRKEILDAIKDLNDNNKIQYIYKYDLIDLFTEDEIRKYFKSLDNNYSKVSLMFNYYKKFNIFSKDEIIDKIMNLESYDLKLILSDANIRDIFSNDNIKEILSKMDGKEKLRAIQDNLLYDFIDKEELDNLVTKFKEKKSIVVFDEIIGKTLSEINKVNIDGINQDELYFKFKNGDEYQMYHNQDCCERVYIEDIEGDLDDLIGVPLLVAEEVSSENTSASESGTWTFYKFATIKGHVTIRWYGSSNGYYSEKVKFQKIN